MSRDLAAIVLAAGMGTRMKSELPKVLHPVCGRPMVDWALDAVHECGAHSIYAVVGHQGEKVAAHIGDRAVCVTQAERLGTAHAVLQAREPLANFDGDVLIVCGDTPLMRSDTLMALAKNCHIADAPGAILTAQVENPSGYGRILRGLDSTISRIVEHKDASEKELAIREINTGVYCVDAKSLFTALEQVGNTNAQGEYYLTDIVTILRHQGHSLRAVAARDPEEFLGVNSRMELAHADRILRMRTLARFMAEGVSVIDPESTFIDPRAKMARDTTVEPFSAIHGHSEVETGAIIGPGANVIDSFVGENARIVWSWVENSTVKKDTMVGPYAKTRKSVTTKVKE